MKAKEAPEKLYFGESDKGCILVNYSTKESDNEVEYTRTDAFIEKAKKWFIEHTNISQEIETNEDGEPLVDSYIKYAKERFDAANEIFENFKTYMKGE